MSIVECLHGSWRCSVDPDILLALTCAYLQAFKHLYGEENMVPKFHYLHLFALVRKLWGRVQACFTHERKHKCVKSFMDAQTNIVANYEAAVLREARLRGWEGEANAKGNA